MPQPTYTEAVDINLDGRNKLVRFLADNLSNEYLREVFDGWKDDVEFNVNKNGDALYVLPEHRSKTGKEVILNFNKNEIESVEKTDHGFYQEAI